LHNISDFKEIEGFKDDKMNDKFNNILKSFSGEFKFRTAKGIAEETKYSELIVQSFLENLSKQGIIKQLMRKDKKIIWGLTEIGKSMIKK
jgi:hypothetical protein